jgi:hypothetical protein
MHFEQYMAQWSPSQGYCRVHMEERQKDLQEIALLSNVICTVVKSRLTVQQSWQWNSGKGIVVGTIQFSHSLSEQV